MTQPSSGAPQRYLGRREPSQLPDVLERVLDKGIVIAGDVTINVLDIELLNVKVRLLIASVDKAREMGIDWWETDSFLKRGRDGRSLEDRLRRLEQATGVESGETEDGGEETRDEQ